MDRPGYDGGCFECPALVDCFQGNVHDYTCAALKLGLCKSDQNTKKIAKATGIYLALTLHYSYIFCSVVGMKACLTMHVPLHVVQLNNPSLLLFFLLSVCSMDVRLYRQSEKRGLRYFCASLSACWMWMHVRALVSTAFLMHRCCCICILSIHTKLLVCRRHLLLPSRIHWPYIYVSECSELSGHISCMSLQLCRSPAQFRQELAAIEQ